MDVLNHSQVCRLLDFPSLIDRLQDAFRSEVEVPLRHQHRVPAAGPDGGNTLLLMPAWQKGGLLGVKIVTVAPANPAQGLPLINGSYLLMEAETGKPLALLDGPALTVRRTAAASALASRYLSRPDSRKLVMVGAGALAPQLIGAHASIRPIERVCIWNRHPSRAEHLAEGLRSTGPRFEVVEDLERAVRGADIVSCATPSRAPLVMGEWLRAGTHLDLVGSFTPDMREVDQAAVLRSAVFVDTRQGALGEAGELIEALESGRLQESDVQGDLAQLCRGEVAGRTSSDQITLFKSVGTALEDLAAAQLALERA